VDKINSLIPWKDLGAEIIIESSGALRSRSKAAGHLKAGAKRVIISAPSDDADATEKVLPQLKGKMTGLAMRVPVPNGSVTDMMICLGKDVTSKQVNAALQEASGKAPLRGILRMTEEAPVSQDIIGDTHSSIVDAQSTMVLNDRIVKILAWCDNEWGYSARLVDFAEFMAGKGESMKKA
jgi:glyceraldehyde 3-phosphate dehydrogenase